MTFFFIGSLMIFAAAVLIAVALVIHHRLRPPVRHDPTMDAILILSETGVIEFAGHRASMMFGWPEDAMVGMKLDDLIPDRFKEIHRRHAAGYFADQPPKLYEMGRDPDGHPREDVFAVRADGSEFPVAIGLAPTPKIGGRRGVIALVKDLSA